MKRAIPQERSGFPFTQYDSRRRGIDTEIVIGFDFGTSCSKIVIQDVDRHQAYAVAFGRLAPTGHENLLPTRLFVNASGCCSLEPAGLELSLLKNKLFARTAHLDGPGGQSINPEVAAVAYLALALGEARRYFMKDIVKQVVPGTIIWSVNVGLPEKYREPERTKLLETCMLAAWELSVWSDSVTLDLAEYWFEEVNREKTVKEKPAYFEDKDRDLHPDMIKAVPEFVAQVQGYARSDLRRTGLHMMVDVGATTLDASTFSLFDRDDENRYTIWEARVALLGAMSLHMHRLRGVSKIMNRHVRSLIGKVDAVAPTPNHAELVPEISEDDIDGMERDFADRAGRLLAEMIADTHKTKNREAPEWQRGLRVFLCGGGRNIPIYRRRLERLPGLDGSAGPYSWLAPFDFTDLPMPDGLHAPNLIPSEFHRLAVAYGLSFRFEDIGHYEKGPKADDLERKTNEDWRAAYVGPEMT